MSSTHDTLTEWARAQEALKAYRARLDAILAGLFPLQREIVLDPARLKVLACGRRFGKTWLDSRYLVLTALQHAGCLVAYVGATLADARKLCWSKVKDILIDELGMKEGEDYTANETRLDITLANGSIIMLAGGKDVRECNKLRGLSFRLIIMDEAGSFSDEAMQYLMKEVLPAGLGDYRGTLMLTGTPNRTCEGYFHDMATDPRRGAKVWENLTVADNPKFPRWEGCWESMTEEGRAEALDEFFEEECKTFGIVRGSPEFGREYLGLWDKDATEFIYHLGQLHPWEEAWAKLEKLVGMYPDLRNVLGMDTGWIDHTAFVVNGYSQLAGKVWKLYEWSNPGLTFDEIKVHFDIVMKKFNPEICVIDPAGEGKIIRESLAKEMWTRFGIEVVSAEKHEKGTFMRIADSAIRTGKALMPPEGELFRQMSKLQWDKHRQREKEGQPCDLHDAWLYSFRHCYHWLEADAPQEPLTHEEQIKADYWKERKQREKLGLDK